jgi:hypothetical protein
VHPFLVIPQRKTSLLSMGEQPWPDLELPGRPWGARRRGRGTGRGGAARGRGMGRGRGRHEGL